MEEGMERRWSGEEKKREREREREECVIPNISYPSARDTWMRGNHLL